MFKKNRFFYFMFALVFFANAQVYAEKILEKGYEEKAPETQVYVKHFIIGKDDAGFKYCDFEYGIKNTSDVIIDDLNIMLEWKRRSLRKGYVVGKYSYKLELMAEDFKPDQRKYDTKLMVRKWCETIKANGPIVHFRKCIVNGINDIKLCERNFSWKFFTQEEAALDKDSNLEKLGDLSTEESYDKAVKFLLEDDEQLIKTINGVKEKEKSSEEQMEEILNSMDSLALEAKVE